MGIFSRTKTLLSDLSRQAYTGLFFGVGGDDLVNWGTGGGAYLSANSKILYLNRALGKRAEKVGQIEFILKRGDKVIENDPRMKLLWKPNKQFTGPEFWELYQRYYDTVGEVYIWMKSEKEIFEEKQVTELQMLRPDWVTVKIVDEDGNTASYEYTQKGVATEIPATEIIYARRPDPENPSKGESLLKAGLRELNLLDSLTAYQERVVKNGGRVDDVFQFKTPRLTKEQLDEMKTSYAEEVASAKNAGRPLFLGGDTTYQRLGLTPSELSYIESKRASLDDIAIMTGVPATLLGVTSQETFSNADAAIRTFLKETIKPLMQKLTSTFDTVLFPEDELELTFFDTTPEDMDDRRKTAETMNTIGAMTTNEKRIMFGLEPLKDKAADQILIPFNLTPLGAAPIQNEIKKKAVHPLQSASARSAYHAQYIRRMDNRERSFIGHVRSYMTEQEERLMNRLTPKVLAAAVFDEVLEIRLAREKFLPILTALLLEAGADAMTFTGTTPHFTLSGNIVAWLNEKSDIFAKSINRTTFETLERQFKESFDAGESRKELVERIQSTYGDISKGRANTIARTEVTGAVQKGTIEGYRQAGLTIKIWVAVIDSHTRDSHYAQDGEERPIDVVFSNGLQYPGDSRGSAEEVINCRCSI